MPKELNLNEVIKDILEKRCPLGELSLRELKILELRYLKEKKLKEIAKEFDVSTTRIQQLIAKAVEKLENIIN